MCTILLLNKIKITIYYKYDVELRIEGKESNHESTEYNFLLPKRDVELVDASVFVFSNTGLASFVPEPPFPEISTPQL
jgi:hypothetical protein